MEVKQESLNLERIALTAVIALLSWNVYTTNQMTIAQAVLQTQVEAIKQQIISQNGQYALRSDFLLLESQQESFEQRTETWLGRLSDRVNALETRAEKKDEEQLRDTP